MFDLEEVELRGEAVASALDADVMVYNGGINSGNDHEFIKLCAARKNKRKNVLLVLMTPGGDAHAAYRIAHCLQGSYEKFWVFVSGWCKSAGTLVAIGANEIFIDFLGELGPIDVQRGKRDELWETSSGLTEDAALEVLEKTAFKMFRDYLLSIKHISRGQVTFNTAAEVAGKMVIGQLGPVYAQIDPSKIGENARAMNIAIDYGLRLNLHSGNLRNRKSLDRLASAYSSHSFVIDEKEAKELFSSVLQPTPELYELSVALGDEAHFPLDDGDDAPFIKFISKELTDEAVERANEAPPNAPEHDVADSGGTDGQTPYQSAHVVALHPERTGAEGPSQNPEADTAAMISN
jgi:hypothetical protein